MMISKNKQKKVKQMKKQNNPSIELNEVMWNVFGAVLDEDGNCIGQDEFPLDEDKFVDLYKEAFETGEVYELDNAAEICPDWKNEVALYAIKHEGKTIVFKFEAA